MFLRRLIISIHINLFYTYHYKHYLLIVFKLSFVRTYNLSFTNPHTPPIRQNSPIEWMLVFMGNILSNPKIGNLRSLPSWLNSFLFLQKSREKWRRSLPAPYNSCCIISSFAPVGLFTVTLKINKNAVSYLIELFNFTKFFLLIFLDACLDTHI